MMTMKMMIMMAMMNIAMDDDIDMNYSNNDGDVQHNPSS